MKLLSVPSLLLAVALLAAVPSSTRAGDEEWADAGKVMAGVLGYQLVRHLYDVHSRDRYEPVRQVRYAETPRVRQRKAQPTVVTHYGTVDYITPRRTVAYDTWPPATQRDNVRAELAEERARLAEERARIAEEKAALAEARAELAAEDRQSAAPVSRDIALTQRAVRRDDGLVLQINEERRIWQPVEKGATAYLQAWSEVEQAWVKLKEYPSFY